MLARFFVAFGGERGAHREARDEIALVDLECFGRREDGGLVIASRFPCDGGPCPRGAGTRAIGRRREGREGGFRLRECAATEELAGDEDPELGRVAESLAGACENLVGLGLAMQTEKRLDEICSVLDRFG